MTNQEIETQLYKKLSSGESPMQIIDKIMSNGWGTITIKIENSQIVYVEHTQKAIRGNRPGRAN